MTTIEEKQNALYNIFYTCNYHTYEDNKELTETEEFKSFSEEEKYYLEKKIYQDDLLNIFGIEMEDEFNGHNLNQIIHELYLKLEKHKGLKALMNELGGEDPELGLMIMFSIDLLYLSHPCFCEFLEKSTIDDDNFELFKKKIHNIF